MNSFAGSIAIGALAVFSVSAFAQGNADDDTPPLTQAETSQAKAEWLAAKAKWASMTPEQMAAVTKQRQAKRLAYLANLEAISDDDLPALTQDETAEFKAMRQSARANWASMSPEEKTATKQAARQKMLSELTTLERVAGPGS